jgi:hypothetical protein
MIFAFPGDTKLRSLFRERSVVLPRSSVPVGNVVDARVDIAWIGQESGNGLPSNQGAACLKVSSAFNLSLKNFLSHMSQFFGKLQL